jgi:hypothetical protein
MRTAMHFITRARRQAVVTVRLQSLTLAVKALSSSTMPPDQARAIVARYCRAIGAGKPSDVVQSLLCSQNSAPLDSEGVDALLFKDADVGGVVAGRVREARR